jgi:hypothetical protein
MDTATTADQRLLLATVLHMAAIMAISDMAIAIIGAIGSGAIGIIGTRTAGITGANLLTKNAGARNTAPAT